MCNSKKFWRLVGIAFISCSFLIFSFHLFAEDRESTYLFKPVPVAKGGVLTPGEEEQLAKIKDLKTTKDLWVAELNLNLFQSKAVTLNMSDDRALSAVTDSIEKRSDNDFTWFGKIPELSETGQAVLVVKDGQMTGSVYAGTELYQVSPLGSGHHAIIHVDQSKFPPDEGDDPRKVEQVQKELQEKYGDKHSDKDASDSFDSDITADKDEIPILKVMVAYTRPAMQLAGGKAQMEAKIQEAVDLSNLSFKNSNIRLKMRLVHQFELNFLESRNIHNDIAKFTQKGNTRGDEVYVRRDKYRGDVVALIISQAPLDAGCGVAAAVGPNPQKAFCVVTFACLGPGLSFTHEIGHLLGCSHHWEESWAERNWSGRTNHGSWYKGKEKKDGWSTIMSYWCPGRTWPPKAPAYDSSRCPRLPYWSNPEIKINGVPAGSNGCCNNAATINANARRVSKFR